MSPLATVHVHYIHQSKLLHDILQIFIVSQLLKQRQNCPDIRLLKLIFEDTYRFASERRMNIGVHRAVHFSEAYMFIWCWYVAGRVHCCVDRAVTYGGWALSLLLRWISCPVDFPKSLNMSCFLD